MSEVSESGGECCGGDSCGCGKGEPVDVRMRVTVVLHADVTVMAANEGETFDILDEGISRAFEKADIRLDGGDAIDVTPDEVTFLVQDAEVVQ